MHAAILHPRPMPIPAKAEPRVIVHTRPTQEPSRATCRFDAEKGESEKPVGTSKRLDESLNENVLDASVRLSSDPNGCSQMKEAKLFRS